jgi:hypothetical protein
MLGWRACDHGQEVSFRRAEEIQKRRGDAFFQKLRIEVNENAEEGDEGDE